MASRDAARFVGRTEELARLGGLLEESAPVSVVLLHGSAGVGKSALLRELARQAEARGIEAVTVEARDLAPLAEALDRAIEPALEAARPLLLLDSWERLSALDSHLRQELLPRLPSAARVVIASRRPPGPGWFTGGWENLVAELDLGPLGQADAEALLAARGLDDPLLRIADPGLGRRLPACPGPRRRRRRRSGRGSRRGAVERRRRPVATGCWTPSPRGMPAGRFPSPPWPG